MPVAALLICLLLPPELSVHLGGLKLSGYRVLLLIMFLPMLYQLMLAPALKTTPADWCMCFVSAWSFVALVANHTVIEAIEKGGILIVEMLGAYLVARVYIRSYAQLQAVAFLMVCITALVLIVSIPESLSGVHFLRGSNITIYPERFGLHRAYGPFDHPILHGVVCAAAFSYAYYLLADNISGTLNRLFPLFIVCAATFFALSAGPYIALATQIGLVIWDRLSKNFKGRWWFVIVTIVSIYIALDIASNRSPVAVLISYLSFSGQTAYMRLLIFDFGSAEVLRHPLLGIGFNEWVRPGWMPPSVDNFWLLTAMRYGLPTLLGIVAVMAYMVIRIGSRDTHSELLRNAGRAWGFTLAGFVLVGCTVHFWNATFILFFFLLGSGCWLLEYKDAPEQVPGKYLSRPLWPVRSTLF